MSRVHDMGGQTGFGPVPLDDDGQAFHADWEARVYALTVALRRRGIFTSDEFRDAIERIEPQQYLAAPYFERWLLAAQMLLAEKGLLAGTGAPADTGAPAGHGTAGADARPADG